MPNKLTFKLLPAIPFQLLVVIVFMICGMSAAPCLAAPAPTTCDPQGGIWNFGLEWIADTCVPNDMSDSTVIHYKNNAVVCNQTTNQVGLYASYGYDTASVYLCLLPERQAAEHHRQYTSFRRSR